MRRTIHWLLVSAGTLTLLGAPSVLERRADAAEKFPFASGKIVYKINNPQMSGTSTISWTDYGRKYRQDLNATAKAEERKIPLNSWQIFDGKYVYSHAKSMGKKVQRMKVPPQALKSIMQRDTPLIAPAQNVGKRVGKGTILGKPCEIREMSGIKLWMWKGLALKMDMSGKQGFALSMEAIRMDTSSKVPASQFRVPTGYKVTDVKMPPPPKPPKSTPKSRK